uniref:La-related protein 6A n=1 Tax=Tanacetum cinerariifolium TaxID=118510 RepID=A0A6L2M2D7_TANCI|nr:la-related protein 6A [Tanacetum cinerariifolium]
MGRFDMENGYKVSRVELVCRNREAKHSETRYGDSDFEACYNNKRRWIDIPNKEDNLKAIRKQESIFTCTECANMFKKGGVLRKYGHGILLPIEVNTRPNNLLTTNAIASQEPPSEENEEEDEALSRPFKKKKTEPVTNDIPNKEDTLKAMRKQENIFTSTGFKKIGHRVKVVGKNQGILLPIEVNTRPNNLLTTNAIASQEPPSEENEEEDEALSRPFKKKKTEQDWHHGMRVKLLKRRVKNGQRKKGHDSEKRSSVQADSLGEKESEQSSKHHDDTPNEEHELHTGDHHPKENNGDRGQNRRCSRRQKYQGPSGAGKIFTALS